MNLHTRIKGNDAGLLNELLLTFNLTYSDFFNLVLTLTLKQIIQESCLIC